MRIGDIFLIFLMILFPIHLSSNEIISLKSLENIDGIFTIKKTKIPFTGNVKEFYQNKKIKFIGSLIKGEKAGEWKHFEENGVIWLLENYKSGKKFGPYIRYHINGLPWKKGLYENDKKNWFVDIFLN